MEEAWLDYELPEALVAQAPAERREASRLMVVPRAGGELRHRERFAEVVEELRAGDVLVVNDSAVFPARVRGRRAQTGGKVEALLVDPLGGGRWSALVKCGGKLQAGEALELGDGALRAEVLGRREAGMFELGFESDAALHAALDEVGEVPLPPYIDPEASEVAHRERYQCVYARERGSVAAPTAGLHWTDELLDEVQRRGVELRRLALHVGLGTFLPIRAERLDDHDMHAERYLIPEATRRAVEQARGEGRRVIANGTTAVRALESWAATGEAAGETRLFIRPGYEFRVVDGMITNFHLPRSTLLALVAAFLGGPERLREVYGEAIARGYRFYSYGDASLLL